MVIRYLKWAKVLAKSVFKTTILSEKALCHELYIYFNESIFIAIQVVVFV